MRHSEASEIALSYCIIAIVVGKINLCCTGYACQSCGYPVLTRLLASKQPEHK